MGITIPNSVTKIGNSAFEGCSSFTNITIPNSVTKIGDGAFYMCTSLSNAIIPNIFKNIKNVFPENCNVEMNMSTIKVS